MKRHVLSLCLAAGLAIGTSGRALAHDASTASSALSALPVAVVLAAPSGVLVGGATLTVVAVQASAEGTVWLLESASDGARASLLLADGAVRASGAVVVVTAVAAGWVLSTAGQVVAFVPNAVGESLLYNRQVTP